jgi:hypothetical protein
MKPLQRLEIEIQSLQRELHNVGYKLAELRMPKTEIWLVKDGERTLYEEELSEAFKIFLKTQGVDVEVVEIHPETTPEMLELEQKKQKLKEEIEKNQKLYDDCMLKKIKKNLDTPEKIYAGIMTLIDELENPTDPSRYPSYFTAAELLKFLA